MAGGSQRRPWRRLAHGLAVGPFLWDCAWAWEVAASPLFFYSFLLFFSLSYFLFLSYYHSSSLLCVPDSLSFFLSFFLSLYFTRFFSSPGLSQATVAAWLPLPPVAFSLSPITTSLFFLSLSLSLSHNFCLSLTLAFVTGRETHPRIQVPHDMKMWYPHFSLHDAMHNLRVARSSRSWYSRNTTLTFTTIMSAIVFPFSWFLLSLLLYVNTIFYILNAYAHWWIGVSNFEDFLIFFCT